MAIRKAVEQVDDETINLKPPGGVSDILTMNALAGLLFLVGVIAIVIFAAANLQ